MTRTALDTEEVSARHHTATATRTTAALSAAVADIPALLTEINRLRTQLTLTRIRYANLLAAARATLAADRDGEHDPLFYVRDELAEHGQLPPAHLHPAQLLAQTAVRIPGSTSTDTTSARVLTADADGGQVAGAGGQSRGQA